MKKERKTVKEKREGFYLSDNCIDMIDSYSRYLGISKSSFIEMSVRHLAHAIKTDGSINLLTNNEVTETLKKAPH